MATVLLLTASERRREMLATVLQQGGLTMAWVPETSPLDSLGAEEAPDLLLVDAPSLPWEQVEAALAVRETLRAPLLLVVREAHLSYLPQEGGADDFLLEPVQPGELLARCRHLLARARGRGDKGLLRLGDLVIDQDRYEVRVGGRKVILTYKEYELLRFLAAHPGRVFTREELLNKVWGYDYFGGTRTVDVHIRRLRGKIEDAAHTFLETVWNVGYRFKTPEGS